MFFKYWVFIFAFIFSLLLSWWALASGYFSSVFLLEKEETTIRTDSRDFYTEKQQIVRSFSSLQAKVLHWALSSTSWELLSQDNLLVISGLVLPRLTKISNERLSSFVESLSHQSFDNQYLSRFFIDFLWAPLENTIFGQKSPDLESLPWTLHDYFWLNCLEGNTKNSFVCKSYISTFLDQFFLYDLDNTPSSSDTNIFEWKNDLTNSLVPELQGIYTMLKSDSEYRSSFCQWLIRYGWYWGMLDDRFSEIFRDCGSENYAQFSLLRDFYSLSRGFSLGYVDARVYTNPLLNQYKLFSLQQLIYKQLSSSSDVKSLMQSYLNFLHEILTREGNKNTELLGNFSKTFSYWYNMNILSPYLKDEKSRMSKEDRVMLMGDLLRLNYGDKVSNFIGLEEQSRYSYDTSSTSEFQNISRDQSLEKLFRSSYLPAQFTLISIYTWENNNTLLIKWVDRKTDFTIQVTLKYENIQLFVQDLVVENNKKLTDYLNAIISKENYSLNKVLSLMAENAKIAEQTQPLNLDLCLQLQEKYKKELTSCSDNQVKITLWSWENLSNWSQPLIYTLTLEKGVLKKVQLSDKILEAKLLKELDLSLVDATSTYYMITSLVGYIPTEETSGFGMKDHLLVTDKFSKYFGITPEKVVSEWGDVQVYFQVWDIKFIGTYDIITNELNPIALDFDQKRRPVVVQNFILTLNDNEVDTLNRFLLDPLAYLKNINAALVKKYFPNK